MAVGEVRALLAYQVGRDPTAITSRLVASALSQLEYAKTDEGRTQILSMVGDVATRLREPKLTPSQILSVLGDPKYVSLGLLDSGYSSEPALGGIDLGDNVRQSVSSENLGREDLLTSLVGRKPLPVKREDIESLLQAVSGLTSREEQIRALGKRDSAAYQIVMRVAQIAGSSAIKSNDTIQLSDVREKVMGDVVTLLTDRSAELKRGFDIYKGVQSVAGLAKSKELDQLQHGSVSAQGVRATAMLINALTDVPGLVDPGSVNDIKNMANVVTAGVQLYQALGPVIALGSGGTFPAAMAILSVAGPLSGLGAEPPDNSAKVLEAMANLTALVRREFSRVNAKLDKISDQLSAIEDSLTEIKVAVGNVHKDVKEALERIKTVQADLPILFQSQAEMEKRLKDSIKATSKLWNECNSQLKYKIFSPPKTVDEFINCVEMYADLAKQSDAPVPELHGTTRAQRISESFWASKASTMSADKRSAYYHFVADAAYKEFDLKVMGRFAEEPYRTDLASAYSSSVSVDQFLRYARKFGARFLTDPQNSTFKTLKVSGDLEKAARQMETLERFISNLRGPRAPSENSSGTAETNDHFRYQRLTSIVDRLSGDYKYLGTVWFEVRDAIVRDIMKTQNLPDKVTIPISDCDTHENKYYWEFVAKSKDGSTFNDLRKADPKLLDAIKKMGFLFPTNEMVWQGGGYEFGTPQFYPLLPFTICVRNLHTIRLAPEYLGEDYVIHNAKIQFAARVEFAGISFVPPFVELTSPDFRIAMLNGVARGGIKNDIPSITDEQIKGAILQAIGVHTRQSGMSMPDVDEVIAKARKALLESDIPFSQFRTLQGMPRYWNAENFKLVRDAVDARLTFLKAYLELAYPHLFASDDKLRSFFVGDLATRLPDSRYFESLVNCSHNLMGTVDNRGPAYVPGTVMPSVEILARIPDCSAFIDTPNELNPSQLKNLGETVIETRMKALREHLSSQSVKQALLDEDNFDAGQVRVSVMKLREFLDRGNLPEYYGQ